MELIWSTLLAVPWMGSLVGFAFAVAVIAVLIILAYYAGLYYSVPRIILKVLGQSAMRRI